MRTTISTDATVIVLDGRLDGTGSAEVRAGVREALVGGVGVLRVDMSQVPLVDATGLGVLVAAARSARQMGRQIVLVGVDAHLARLLCVTHLDRVVAVERARPLVSARAS